MGTIAGETGHGLIYLHQDTNKEFTESLTKTHHKSPNTFLNELIDIFLKSNEHTQALQVNTELAVKFLALLSGTQFGSCNDLMKHLLSLYSQAQTSKSKNTQNIPQERSSNRKRKSQPRRNIQPVELTEEEAEIIIDTAENEWVEKSGIRDDQRSAVTGSSAGMVDLSVVKQEQPDEGELGNTQNIDKGQFQSDKSLQKTQSTSQNARALDALYLRKLESQLRMKQRLVPNENVKPPLLPNKNVLNPKSQLAGPKAMLNAAPHYMMNQLAGVDKKPKDLDEMPAAADEKYNYVLEGPAILDNSSRNKSHPKHSMHVPVKYPKSNPYVLSSEDEEPQDLSYNEQPQNLTLAKTENVKAKAEPVIKYDKNGNALPELLPLTSPNRFPTPSNLIFNDLHGNNAMMGEHTLLTSPTSTNHKPANIKMMSNGIISPPQVIAVSQDGTKMLENQPIAMTSPAGMAPVQFQVVVPPSQQPIFIPNPLLSQSPSFPGMPLLMAVGSPEQQVVAQGQITPQDDMSPTSGPEGAMDSRRKRKKMDDSSTFRDPPETSLPFNGPNKYRFYCDVCDTGFTRRYTFNRHKCKGRVEKHYCKLCDKAYLSKYKLKDHILVKHEGQTVSCPDCGKKFSSRSSMEMHKKQQHEGQFSIFCKVCGKGFNHTGHYYGHMNKHTNTKPFWCQQCGKRFYGSSYLHNHKQVCRGTNDLNYSCNLCDRKFKCELYLKKHLKIHETNAILTDPEAVAMNPEDKNGPVELGMNKPNPELEGSELDMGQFGPAGGPVFPNGPDTYDGGSNSGMLVIDEANGGANFDKGNLDSGAMLVAGAGGET